MSTFLIALIVFVIACRFIIPMGIKSIANAVSAPSTTAQPTNEGSLGEKLLCIVNFMLLCLLVILNSNLVAAAVLAILFLIELGYAVLCNKSRGGCYLWLFVRKDKSRNSTRNGRGRDTWSKNCNFMDDGRHRYTDGRYYQNRQKYGDDRRYQNRQQYGKDRRYQGQKLADARCPDQQQVDNSETDPVSDKANIAEHALYLTNKYSIYMTTEDKTPARNIKGKPVYSVVGSNKMWINEEGILYAKEDGKIIGLRGKECPGNTMGIATFCFAGEKDVRRIQKHAPKSTISYFMESIGEFEAGYFITQYGDTVVDYYTAGQGFKHMYSYEGVELYEKGRVEFRVVIKSGNRNITLLGGEREGSNTSFILLKELGPTALTPTREEEKYYVYSFTKEGRYISDGGKIRIGSAREEVIKEEDILQKAIKRAQTMTSLEAIKSKINLNVVKTGINKDGIYNNGTFDLMCRFGEIQFAQAISCKPFIQSIVAGKLIHSKTAVDVINRIGDNWKDIKVGAAALHFDNYLTNLIATQESGEWNIWLTDDESVWFISIAYLSVADTGMHVENSTRARIQRMISSVLNSFYMRPDTLLGYWDTVNPIDHTKVKNTIDTQIYVQEYYKLNPATLSPTMFGVYTEKAMGDLSIVKNALLSRAPVDIKMTIKDVVKLKFTGNEELSIYAARAVLSPYEYEQIRLNSNVLIVRVEDSYAPAKLRDIYLKAQNLPASDFIGIVVPCEGIYEFNFITANKKLSCATFAQAALNTILSPYIHYRIGKYVVTKECDVVMFKK